MRKQKDINKKSKRLTSEVEITEQPIPLSFVKPEECPDLTFGIEEHIQRFINPLIRELSEVKFSLKEHQSKNTERIRNLLLALLEVTDAFERVFNNIRLKEDQINQQMDKWISNFHTIRRLLDNALINQGVSKIEILNVEFDPYWHKVSEIIEDRSKKDGTIVEEVKKGYMWNNQILRKVEVIVVRNADTEYNP